MTEFILALAPGWAAAHAIVLAVAAPLIAAPLAALLGSGRLAWGIAVLTTGFSLAMTLVLLATVQETGPVSYGLGGWRPPLGIEFRADALNAVILVLVAGIGFLASLFSLPSVQAEVYKAKRALFYAAFLVCFCGLLGVAVTGDAFNLFVFLEISSISTYVLVALGARQDRRALPAAFNYLMMGTIGATFYVIGVGFLFAATGTLNMAQMAEILPTLEGNRAVQAGFAFIVVGLGLKAAMFPLHQWLPNAYAYAPSFMTVFLSATATKVALYALVRYVFTVFGIDGAFVEAALIYVVMPVAIAAMVATSFQAVFQLDVRRTLAYSSVAQVGYMLLGVSMGTALGLSAGLLHLVNHAVMKGALFMAVAALVISQSGTRLQDLAGAGRTAPWTMTAFAIAALSLIGVPLTAGFQSKFLLVTAAFDRGWWWAAAVIIFASVLAVLYMGRMLEAVFFRAPENPNRVHREAPVLILVPLWILALATLLIGVQAGWLIELLNDAAAAVLGPDPAAAPIAPGGAS